MAANLFLLLTLAVIVDSLKLEQVVILGRHNVRAPLSKHFQQITSLVVPQWDVPAGHLTERGGHLEEILAEYFALWFEDKGLFLADCPSQDSLYVYSNNLPRTIATAKVFTRAAFKNCNISIHFKGNSTEVLHTDPVFSPILRNTSESFIEAYTRHMTEKLNNLHLEDAYDLLGRIVEITNSDICKYESFCDFNMKKDNIVLNKGEEPNVDGPLGIGNAVVDFILMSYYNGVPEAEVAWGKIKSEDEWKSLLDITRENQNVRFNQSLLSKDIARPMLNYLKDLFLTGNVARKMTMLVGHDSNLNSVMAALGFKKYELPGQYELTPVGGKLVFQKWCDDDSKEFLKIEYIYQSMTQIRNATKLTLENPPLSKVMELQTCKVDENGYCPWSDFVNLLETLY